jgi:hypothetical protein
MEHIFTYSWLACWIMLGSGFDDWVYWHFFTIRVNYNSSHIELPLNDVCLANLYEESLAALWISDRSLLLESESELESELLYDWRFTANQFFLATSPLKLTTSNFIFQLSTCGYNLYEISSLTTGGVYRLQLLLVLTSAVILRSEPRGTQDHSQLATWQRFVVTETSVC